MKRFFIIVFLFCSIGIVSNATQGEKNYFYSGESINVKNIESIDQEKSNVSMRETSENNKVEIPTIVLIVLFWLLMLASLILIMFKI